MYSCFLYIATIQ